MTPALQQVESLLVRQFAGADVMGWHGWADTARALQAMTQFARALGDPEIIEAMTVATELAQERKAMALIETCRDRAASADHGVAA